MAHNSNIHNVPWLPNSQTEMSSVYAGNAWSSWLVVGAVANCSTHAGLPHWSFDRRIQLEKSWEDVSYTQIFLTKTQLLHATIVCVSSWAHSVYLHQIWT